MVTGIHPRKYFHDHLVLLLLSINAFLALAGSIFILVKLGTGHGDTPFIQCRDCSNPNAINRFSTGSVGSLYSFVIFALLIFVANTALSLKAYPLHRQLAIVILSLSIILLLLTVIVSNALLVLR